MHSTWKEFVYMVVHFTRAVVFGLPSESSILGAVRSKPFVKYSLRRIHQGQIVQKLVLTEL